MNTDTNNSAIDPIITLAFNLRTNKGAYVALVGSGVSISAGIPSGWQLLMELIRRVARLKGEKEIADPANWYRENFKSEPNYSRLLEILGPTPTERNQILREFFEASPDERSQGIKQPTQAHRAIAKLVSAGYIRVILTPNFDPLMEQALTEQGVSYQLISSPDMISGSLPIAHAQCTIVKLHGDYRDVRTKNTYEELEKYDSKLNLLLDRIFEDYGLIVSGWSATWDKALRDAILRNSNRRFSMFWMTVDNPSQEAKELINFRKALVIESDGADYFFTEIDEKLEALSDLSGVGAIPTEVAVSTLKRFLSEPKFYIRLHDLVQKESNRVLKQIKSGRFSSSYQLSSNELIDRVSEYETHTKTLQALVAHGFYWDQQNLKLWCDTIRKISNTEHKAGLGIFNNLRRYPGLLLYYTAGISAVASGNYKIWAYLARKTRVLCDGKEISPVLSLVHFSVFENSTDKYLPDMENERSPVSKWLFRQLRPIFGTLIQEDRDFEAIFDKFEYLNCLLYSSIENCGYGPIGLFTWRGGLLKEPKEIKLIDEEFQEEKTEWGPIKTGLFRSLEEFRDVKNRVDAFIKDAAFHIR